MKVCHVKAGSLWPAEAYLQYLAQNGKKTPRFRRATLLIACAVRIVAERRQD